MASSGEFSKLARRVIKNQFDELLRGAEKRHRLHAVVIALEPWLPQLATRLEIDLREPGFLLRDLIFEQWRKAEVAEIAEAKVRLSEIKKGGRDAGGKPLPAWDSASVMRIRAGVEQREARLANGKVTDRELMEFLKKRKFLSLPTGQVVSYQSDLVLNEEVSSKRELVFGDYWNALERKFDRLRDFAFDEEQAIAVDLEIRPFVRKGGIFLRINPAFRDPQSNATEGIARLLYRSGIFVGEEPVLEKAVKIATPSSGKEWYSIGFKVPQEGMLVRFLGQTVSGSSFRSDLFFCDNQKKFYPLAEPVRFT